MPLDLFCLLAFCLSFLGAVTGWCLGERARKRARKTQKG